VLFLHCKGICSKSATFASFSQEQTVPLRSPSCPDPDLPSAYVIKLFERNVDEANLTGLNRSIPLPAGLYRSSGCLLHRRADLAT
jgi:hypothetical protein